jgi:chromosome segregation ATPase
MTTRPETAMRPAFLPPAVAALLALGLVAAALAQPANGPSREREALRRAQAALLQSQQERDGLLAEKAALERRLQEADAAGRQGSGRLAVLQRDLAAQRERADKLQAELQAQRETATRQTEAMAQERGQAEARLREQLAQAQLELAERTGANRGLSARLEQVAVQLAEAEARNRRLHQLGSEAVELYASKNPAETLRQSDPLLGLAAVRIEGLAETLRLRLDTERLPGR